VEQEFHIIEKTNVWLWRTQLELDDGNFCFFHASGSASRNNHILMQDNAIDELSIFYGSANFLYNTNISQIYVRRGGCYEASDCCDRDWCQCRRVLRYDLFAYNSVLDTMLGSLRHTLEFKEVLAARNKLGLSLRSTGVEISVRYSTAFTEAFRKASAMMVGCMPFCNIFSAAPKKLPARTTTDVVPSPASISCAADKSTS
jgi:hypothetical protein